MVAWVTPHSFYIHMPGFSEILLGDDSRGHKLVQYKAREQIL